MKLIKEFELVTPAAEISKTESFETHAALLLECSKCKSLMLISFLKRCGYALSETDGFKCHCCKADVYDINSASFPSLEIVISGIVALPIMELMKKHLSSISTLRGILQNRQATKP